MKRTVLLLLLGALAVMLVTSAVWANGRAKGERPSVSAEPEVKGPAPAPQMPTAAPAPAVSEAAPPVQTSAQAVGVVTCGINTPLAMAMNPVVKADCNDVFVVAGGSIFKFDRSMCLKKQTSLMMANCSNGAAATAVGTPALAIADQDVYVVAGNMVARFDRELSTVTQVALPLPNCTAIAVTPGQVVMTSSTPACPPQMQVLADQSVSMPGGEALLSIGMTMNPAIFVDNQDVFVVAAGSVFKFDRALGLRQQAMMQAGNCAAVALPPGQTVAPEALHAVSTALGTPAISVIDQDVYVVAGSMTAHFDRNLNSVLQAALPFQGGIPIALLPGGPIGFTQVAAGPAPCPPGTAPVVAGFTSQPIVGYPAPASVVVTNAVQPGAMAPSGRWTARLNGDTCQRRTYASGKADFTLSGDGQTLHSRLFARNIWDVTCVQLLLVSPGGNVTDASVVATLATFNPPTLAITGRLASCSISACDLTGCLQGQPLSALINAMNAGQILVSVSTSCRECGQIAGLLTAAPCS